MPEDVRYEQIVALLTAAADEIDGNHELLSKLDSVGGDGDHGTTMVRAMGHLRKAVEAHEGGDIAGLLQSVGWAIMGVDGGATGPLLGTLFMSMSEAVQGKDALDAGAVAALFEAGFTGVSAQTKARVGDKTMIDALTPAVAAMREAADAGTGIAEAFERAATAAEQGAASTKELQARFGRARNIKEASIGTPDPGATSVSLLFRGFWKGITHHA